MTSTLLWLALACVPKQPAPTTGAAAAPAETPSTASGGDAWSTPPSTEPAPASASTTAAPAATGSTAASGPASKMDSTSQRHLDDSAALLAARDSGRAEAALRALESVAREHPDVPEVYYNMGLAHELLGDASAARRAWTRATELDPAFAPAWLNLGVLSARGGKYDIALATFQNGTRYNERDMSLRAATVSTLRALGRHEDAVAAARAALAINSRALPVYTNLAQVYLATKRVDLARFTLEKALVDIPAAAADPLLHAVLGQVYSQLGYEAQALAEYRKALELDPFQVDALQALGTWQLDNRAWADAAQVWERLVSLAPGQVGARLNLGIAYRGLNRYADARRLYEECLRLDPQNPEPYRNLAVLAGDYEKDYDGALVMLDKYRAAGGGPAAEIDKWADALKKDKARKAKAEERKRQDEERKRQEETRRAAEEKRAAEQPAPQEPAPAEPAPGGDNPWGGGG